MYTTPYHWNWNLNKKFGSLSFSLLYTVLRNINEYVPFLINTLDPIAKGRKYAKSVFTQSKMPDVVTGEDQNSRHAADPPRASRAVTLNSNALSFRQVPEAFLDPPGGGLPSLNRWQVLHFVNVIKISI